jgi:hypothetical protein
MEVLIACGVLVLGLSSIAALLPAAGARLGQANLEDRAGTLAANAYADVVSRRLTKVDLFPDPAKSLAFGKGLMDVPALAPFGQLFAAPTASLLGRRIDAERGFLLEDEVLVVPAAAAPTPANEFDRGRRAFKEGVCWGATLVPGVAPGQPGPPTAEAGSPATLSIAVFRKPPATMPIELTNTVIRPPSTEEETLADGLLTMTAASEAVMKKFLKNCSYVLVPPADATKGPRWCRILASWKTDDERCYVAFDDAGAKAFAGSTFPVTVIGFDGLVRLDQYNVILK